MLNTILIITQVQIDCMHNTKAYFWVLHWRRLCEIMEQIRPKTGNSLANFLGFYLFYWHNVFLFVKIINMFRFRIPPPKPLSPNFLFVFSLYYYYKKIYHGIVSDKISAQHKEGLVSVAWDNTVSPRGAATVLNEESLGIFWGFISVFINFMSSCSWKSSTCSGLKFHHHNLFSPKHLVSLCYYY